SNRFRAAMIDDEVAQRWRCGKRLTLYRNRELSQTAHRRQPVLVGVLVQLGAERPLLGEQQPESLIAIQTVHCVSHPEFASFPCEPQGPEVLFRGYCRIQANTLAGCQGEGRRGPARV